MFKCNFRSMQGCAGCSPERPLRQQEGMGHPRPPAEPQPSSRRAAPGSPRPAGCGGARCPRGCGEPCCRRRLRGRAGPLPPHKRSPPAAAALPCAGGAASTVARDACRSCVTPRSFSGEMFHLGAFSLLRTGRLFRILVRNKNKTKQNKPDDNGDSPARRRVAPGSSPGSGPVARYSPSGPPRAPLHLAGPTPALSGAAGEGGDKGTGQRAAARRRLPRHRRLQNNRRDPLAAPTGPAAGPAAAPCPEEVNNGSFQNNKLLMLKQL